MFAVAVIAFSSSHCCTRNPKKNLSQKVKIRVSIVAVALICGGTPSKVKMVVMAISGSTRAGKTTAIEHAMKITAHGVGKPRANRTK